MIKSLPVDVEGFLCVVSLVVSGQKPLSHCVTAPLSWEPKNRRFKAVPEREGGIAKQ